MRYIPVLLSVILLVGCSSTTTPTQVATAVITEEPTQAAQPAETSAPSASPESKGNQTGNSNLCEWFFKTQLLRSERVSAGVELGEVFLQENPEPAEFLQAVKDYRPYQDKFIAEWLKLGPHPEAQEFWEKELSSIQIQVNAFDAMIEGLENADQEGFEEGMSLFQDAQKFGQEAETAMLKIRAKCMSQ